MNSFFKKLLNYFANPGRVTQLVASSGCAKVVDLIPGQGTYKKQAMNA